MKHILSVLSLLLWAQLAYAGNNTVIEADKDLSRALTALKHADGYAYRLTITTFGQAGNKDSIVSTEAVRCYSSQASFVYYVQSAGMQQLTCTAGSFRSLESKKEVAYRQYGNDSMLQVARAGFNVSAGALIDSVLLHGAYIRQKKVEKGLTHYFLAYGQPGMVQEMEVTLNAAKDFVAAVRYRVVRPLAPGAGQPTVTQEMAMDDYQQAPPAPVTAMLVAIHQLGLKAYLAQQYPAYRLRSF